MQQNKVVLDNYSKHKINVDSILIKINEEINKHKRGDKTPIQKNGN